VLLAFGRIRRCERRIAKLRESLTDKRRSKATRAILINSMAVEGEAIQKIVADMPLKPMLIDDLVAEMRRRCERTTRLATEARHVTLPNASRSARAPAFRQDDHVGRGGLAAAEPVAHLEERADRDRNSGERLPKRNLTDFDPTSDLDFLLGGRLIPILIASKSRWPTATTVKPWQWPTASACVPSSPTATSCRHPALERHATTTRELEPIVPLLRHQRCTGIFDF